MNSDALLNDPRLLDRARQVRLLALDVDGVMTDGRLYFAVGRQVVCLEAG